MTVIDIILGTPGWVWGVFAYVVMVGVLSTRDRCVPLLSMFGVPVMFSILGVKGIESHYGFSSVTLAYWGTGILLGTLLGWAHVRKAGIRVIDPKKCLLFIPGSYATLCILLGFFIVKYVRGVLFSLNPELRLLPEVMITDLILMGFFLGFLAGRLMFYVKEVRRSFR